MKNRLTLPADAVAVDGVRPQVGDSLDVQATCKVVSVDGDNITLEVTRANDQDMAAGEPDKTPDDGGRADALKSFMGKGDDDAGY